MHTQHLSSETLIPQSLGLLSYHEQPSPSASLHEESDTHEEEDEGGGGGGGDPVEEDEGGGGGGGDPVESSANTEILASTNPESIHDVLDTNRHMDTTGWKRKVAFTVLPRGKVQLGSLPPCLRSDLEILHQPLLSQVLPLAFRD
jgi:hypothetical protein